jgi:phage-related minor tail protein
MFNYSLTGTTGTLHLHNILFAISRSVLLKMRNVSGRSSRYKQNIFCVEQRFSENRFAYEKMWKNVVEWGRPQITV